MTVFEQHSHELFQAMCQELIEARSLQKCKVKVFNTKLNDGIEGYENAVNAFMEKHHIVKVVPTQSDYMHSMHIFYKD